MTTKDQIKLAESLIGETITYGSLNPMIVEEWDVTTEKRRSSGIVNETVKEKGVCVYVKARYHAFPVMDVTKIELDPLPEGYVRLPAKFKHAAKDTEPLLVWRNNKWDEIPERDTGFGIYAAPADHPVCKENNVGRWDKEGVPEPKGGWGKYEDLGWGPVDLPANSRGFAYTMGRKSGFKESEYNGRSTRCYYIAKIPKQKTLLDLLMEENDKEVQVKLTTAELIYLWGITGNISGLPVCFDAYYKLTHALSDSEVKDRSFTEEQEVVDYIDQHTA